MCPSVSVIVPVYNVESYLPKCVNSLLKQTLKDLEIILVDDGSSDNCGKICDEYREKDKRIKVIHKKNGGPSLARNSGLEKASGEYIAFVDSDDWCEPDMLEKLYKTGCSYKADVVVAGTIIDYANDSYSITKQFARDQYCTTKVGIAKAITIMDEAGVFNTCWNKFYRREVIVSNSLVFKQEYTTGEDLLFNCEYFKHIQSVNLVTAAFYHYVRRDEETLVAKYRKDLYAQVNYFNSVRKELYNYYNMRSEAEQRCYARTYIEYIFSCIPNIYRKQCDMSVYEKYRFIRELMQDKQHKAYFGLYQPDSFYGQLFQFLFILKNSFIMYGVYSILFLMRNNLEQLYRAFRKKMIGRYSNSYS